MSEQYVYQHGTLGGLMESLMAGTAEIGTLLTQGDFGIGTLEGSNGEIIFWTVHCIMQIKLAKLLF